MSFDHDIVFTLDTGRSVYLLRDDSLVSRDRFSLFRSNCDNPPLAVFGGPREWSIVQSLAVITSDILMDRP